MLLTTFTAMVFLCLKSFEGLGHSCLILSLSKLGRQLPDHLLMNLEVQFGFLVDVDWSKRGRHNSGRIKDTHLHFKEEGRGDLDGMKSSCTVIIIRSKQIV